MRHNNNTPGSVFSLVCGNLMEYAVVLRQHPDDPEYLMEYAVVLRQHPDDANLLLMVPISHGGSIGTTDICFPDKLWNPDYVWLLENSPDLPWLRKWILESMNNPVDESVIAHCGHTFWIEAEKLTSLEDNMEKRNLRFHAEHKGYLQEQNLKLLIKSVHALVTGRDFHGENLHDEGTAEYEEQMNSIERDIRYIEAK